MVVEIDPILLSSSLRPELTGGRAGAAAAGAVQQAVETACTGLSTNRHSVFTSGPLLWSATKGATQSLTGL